MVNLKVQTQDIYDTFVSKFTKRVHKENQTESETKIQTSFKRWIILGIFMWYGVVNGFVFVEYSIISTIVEKYYKVSSVAVNWTTVCYMALYAPFFIPASYITDKKGLRAAALVGCLGTFLGTSVKLFSIPRDRFYVVMIGQCISSISQTLIMGLPPKLASVWFPSHEVSTASSLGILGGQMGVALGFLISSSIVKDHEKIEDIGRDFNILCSGLAILMIPPVIGTVLFFPKQPKQPPSLIQLKLRECSDKFSIKFFFGSIKKLCTNVAFLLHISAFAINFGAFSAVSTVLNDLLFPYFHSTELSGRMGLVMVAVGLGGLVIFGVILDRTHLYKEINLTVYILTAVSTGAMIFALHIESEILVYVTIALFGLFTNAYMSTSFELAMELVYPIEESITTGLILAVGQILSVPVTVAVATILTARGSIWALSTLVILLGIGSVLSALIPNRLRRQAAFAGKTIDEM